MLSKSQSILSSHKDAASRIAAYLRTSQNIHLKQSAVLEVLAQALGTVNWQTLHAMALEGRAPHMPSSPTSELKTGHSLITMKERLAPTELQLGLTLSDEQREAALVMLRHPTTVLTGARNTGKALTMKVLTSLMEAAHRPTVLVAPTEEGAKEATTSMGRAVSTIRQVLGQFAAGGASEGWWLPLKCQTVVVFDAHLLEADLLQQFIKDALAWHCQLILVGESCTLSPIVLASRGTLATVHLRTVMRQPT